MPTMPVPTNTDLAVQNNTTGQVDFLQFQGSTLVGSDLVNYVPTGWNVVAQGHFDAGNHLDMVIQNPASGAVDFLTLDASGNLIGSAMSNTSVAPIIGQGFFGFAGQQGGPVLVSQLANGELDMLGFDSNGQLIASDAIASSVGFAHAVGVGEGYFSFQPFAGVGGSNDDVVLQLGDGSIDCVGFSGDYSNGTLSFSSSLMLPGSAGNSAIEAVNQQNGTDRNASIPGGTGTGGATLQGVQFVEQLANGSLDSVYADSGYGDAAHEGTLYASDLLNLGMPGWQAVDAGAIAREIFPIT
jgi:hypothetical protein